MEKHNRRQAILDTAVAILAERGMDATVSEIAAAAGVNDSVLYHYFKNKEDLMFYTVGAYLKDTQDAFYLQLQGIREPVSRLSKLIWQQLQFHNNNPNYTKYTLFSCRSKKSFFQHETFGYFFDWAKILKNILQDGVQSGVFAQKLPVTVARDMILGLIDMENIEYFTGHRGKATEADFNVLLDMVLDLVTEDRNRPVQDLDKREATLRVAEKIFAQKDYHKATTAEIAKSAGISEATLYEYFRNKEDILFASLKKRLEGHLETTEEFFARQTPLSKLVRFIYYHFTMYLRQPAFVKNFILNGIYNVHFYQSRAYDKFQRYLAIIDEILDEGKADGSFRHNIDHRLFKHMLVGVFSYSALR